MLPKAITAELSLDAKGRVMLPSDLRRWLEYRGINRLVAFGNNGPEGGLAFCRIDQFDAIRERFGGAGPVHPEARLWALAMASTAATVKVDGAGRVLIPVAQRNRFGLDKDLYLFTANDWFEVWAMDRYEAWYAQATQNWDRIAGFGSLGSLSALGGVPAPEGVEGDR